MGLCVFGLGHGRSEILERNGPIKEAVISLRVKDMLANHLIFD